MIRRERRGWWRWKKTSIPSPVLRNRALDRVFDSWIIHRHGAWDGKVVASNIDKTDIRERNRCSSPRTWVFRHKEKEKRTCEKSPINTETNN